MDERRKYERYRLTLEIKVSLPEKESNVGTTVDFSDGGALINVKFEQPPSPETEAFLQLNDLVAGREPPLLKARVVRVSNEGIAFEFIKDGEEDE